MLRLAVLLVAVFVHQSFADEPEAIVGGQPAAPGEFPYQCSLSYDNYHICGCSIINSNQVITAAHCVDFIEHPFSILRIVTGSNNPYTGQKHEVKTVRVHPGYSARHSWVHDIAVITLRAPIQFNALTYPVALPTSMPNIDSQCVLSGWGLTSANGQPSTELLKMTTFISSRTTCERDHGLPVYPNQVCAFTRRGIGACQGDSGSPLVCNGQQVGIASWVRPCALGIADVYTSVYHHLEFIEQAKQDI